MRALLLPFLPLLPVLGLACAPSAVAPGADAGVAEEPDASGSPDAGDTGPTDAGTALPDCTASPLAAPAQDARWNDLATLASADLAPALRQRTAGHTSLSYNDARRAIFNATQGLDVHDGTVECIYTGRTAPAAGATSNGFNVEHAWPQSDGAAEGAARSDLHHLFASDSEANLRRSSLPFAMSDCDADATCRWTEGGSQIGMRRGGTDTVFEVRPERRGDIARALFYFSVRYSAPLAAADETVLRCWNRSDPPDDRERGRNAGVEALQHNRNPFVDRPDFVERIADF